MLTYKNYAITTSNILDLMLAIDQPTGISYNFDETRLLIMLDLIYTNIYENGRATMKLSNIRLGMRFDKNFQFISCCNHLCVYHATVMSLPCELWWETLQYGTISMRYYANSKRHRWDSHTSYTPALR